MPSIRGHYHPVAVDESKLEPEDEDVDEPTPENHEEKNDEGEKPQSITSIIKISLTVLVIGYALGKIAMLFS